MEFKEKIRDIQDFPKKGIVFKDITTLLKDADALRAIIKSMAQNYKGKKIDYVVSTEARGFIFGAALAYELGCGFVPVRKPGKLPYDTISHSYEKEYGFDTLHIHKDALGPGDKVLVTDDLLATGGTIKATEELVKKLGADIVGFCFLIELSFLPGRKLLGDYDVFSLIKYDGE